MFEILPEKLKIWIENFKRSCCKSVVVVVEVVVVVVVVEVVVLVVDVVEVVDVVSALKQKF